MTISGARPRVNCALVLSKLAIACLNDCSGGLLVGCEKCLSCSANCFKPSLPSLNAAGSFQCFGFTVAESQTHAQPLSAVSAILSELSRPSCESSTGGYSRLLPSASHSAESLSCYF